MKNGNLPAMLGEYDYQFKDGTTATFKGNGLTKREQFAMAAMQGLRACTDGVYIAEDLARHSVEYADALLAELEKSK